MNAQLPLPVTAPFTKAQRTGLINLVRRAVNSEILPRFRRLDSGQVSTKSGPEDLVTAADIAAEEMIARGLQIAFPSALIVGEESADKLDDYRAALSEAELGFVIDPVDGTWNFAKGVPVFGTMIAACRFGRPVFAMIYDPVGQDFLWADIDTPTTWVPRTGRAVPVQTKASGQLEAFLGILESNAMPMDHKRALALASTAFAGTYSIRCAANHYRMLVQGHVDFYFASSLKAWDHAAGILLCQKAGGHAALLDGTPYDTSIPDGYLLCASSKDVWDQLAEHFADLLKDPT